MPKKVKTVKKIVTENPVVRPPKKTLFLILVVLLAVGLIYLSVRFFLVASVNGQFIGRLSVIKVLEKQGGKRTLETIVLKTLINQEAKKRKVIVSQKDLDEEIKKIETNIKSQGLTLDQLLQQQGMNKNDLTEEIRIQLLVTKMVGEKVAVTDKEIDDYLTSQKAQTPADSTQPAPEMTKDEAKASIKQQKLQENIQTFVTDLKTKAKISYFINY